MTYTNAPAGVLEDLERTRPAYIGGEWAGTEGGRTFDVIDPSSGRVVTAVARCEAGEISAAVESADAAREAWRRTPVVERCGFLRNMAQLLRRDVDRIAFLESLDVGKPLSQARSDVMLAARYFEFSAEAADKVYGETIPFTDDSFGATFLEPIGVTAHITPWNYPLAIAVRSLAPALAMGNTCVLKPAEEAPLSSLELARLADEAGVPAGCLSVVPGPGPEAGGALVGDARVRHVAFTGSPGVGTTIMQQAALNWTPVSLELGGKSPNVVFGDANLDKALDFITKILVQNSGQTCSAATRLLVEEGVHDELVTRLSDRFAKVRLGPATSDPEMGPVISQRQFDRVLEHISAATEAGATVRAGGTPAEAPELAGGYFVSPTVFADVTPEMRIAQEEVFGPVLAVLPFSSDEEAVHLANGTPYGLAGAVWTDDYHRAMRFAHDLECGQVYVNTYALAQDVALPFGGYKMSGFGREKGVQALRNYAQVKAVAFKFDR